MLHIFQFASEKVKLTNIVTGIQLLFREAILSFVLKQCCNVICKPQIYLSLFFCSNHVTGQQTCVGLFLKNKPLSYTLARECLLTRLKEVNGDLNIGFLSLRSGGATKAANAGINDSCWKRHGRWRGENSKDGYIADFGK